MKEKGGMQYDVRMKVIATHVGADFDGFAAMLGLWKLHPEAKLVFPGAKEPGLRQFLQEAGLEVPEIPLKDVQDVQHLILVDAGREDRIGALAEWLHRTPRPYVEVYDHHPEGRIDIQADRARIRSYGSTTTIVVREMMDRPAPPLLTSMEASILLAGIYEDSASFLSAGTTREDFLAAIYLLQHGAEIRIVNRLLTHRLQPEQVSFFNTMVSGCEHLNLEGTWIVISSMSWPAFVPEAATLVHRLMDLEPISVFFALIMMEKRVHVIARSALADVDVGEITAELGGGGHPMAASAVLKGVTLIEAREKLLAVLNGRLRGRRKASDLMKRDIITVELGKKMSDAAEIMNSFRINSLPVIEKDTIVGTLSRQVVDGAVFHGLQERPVRDFMSTEIPLVHPETPMHEVFERMISGRARFVLVGKDVREVEGIITRMDLLRYHYEFSPATLTLRKGRRSENLGAMLRKRLPEPVLHILEQCGHVAHRIDMNVYLVGGMVRDLLLHKENMDVDLVVEGDGIHFAEEFANQTQCKIAVHRRFGTACISFPDGFKIDVATARWESYQSPAALPQVRGGVLRQDLYRRDFTINTLAIHLSPNHFGDLIDYFGGWDDLHQGVIRVLHSLSFVDDPTRALRAIRFATRFNFLISEDTKRLLESAVDSRVLDHLSGKRFWSELRNLLLEEHPIPAIRMLHHYKMIPSIHPQLSLDSFLLDLLYQVQTVLSWFRLNFLNEAPNVWLLYLMVVLEKLHRSDRIAVCQKYQLTSQVQETIRQYKSNIRDIRARLTVTLSPSALYFSLHDFSLEVLLYAMARSPEDLIRQQIADYLRDHRWVRLEINGDDLLKTGLPPGPRVREILEEVLRARLDGTVATREQQLEAAAKLTKTASL